ncbi:MAG: hypothetical protein P1S46_05395, partial [bacterium]|nr:hypothetical protein [bacterium]
NDLRSESLIWAPRAGRVDGLFASPSTIIMKEKSILKKFICQEIPKISQRPATAILGRLRWMFFMVSLLLNTSGLKAEA